MTSAALTDNVRGIGIVLSLYAVVLKAQYTLNYQMRYNTATPRRQALTEHPEDLTWPIDPTS
jgi:hypothetical protein